MEAETMSLAPIPKVVLGTMTFGTQVDFEAGCEILEAFVRAGFSEVDTAYVYNGGESERLLGRALDRLGYRQRVTVATKANPKVTGRMDEAALVKQLGESLQRLGASKVKTFYLHFPDSEVPLEVTLGACAKLHTRGWFEELGVSNFSAADVRKASELSQHHGWPAPTVYQGLYNALSRNVETELFPTLKGLGMRFYAYNPLAGGILSGRYKGYEDSPGPGRFSERPNYLKRYWKPAFFEALNILAQACEAQGVSMVEAAYRWLSHHSALDATRGDGVLVGVSRLGQLEQNLSAVAKAPLPNQVLSAFEAAWNAARAESPPVSRGWKGG